MNYHSSESAGAGHLVVVPYPGRGHINPVLNTCKLLVSNSDNILITVVLTDEWLDLLSSEPKTDRIQFMSIPNVVPSERVRAADISGFVKAVWTKMKDPFERLLDGLQPPATLIMADTFLFWAVSIGNSRNIPVVSFWPMSAAMFSDVQHHILFQKSGYSPVLMSEKEYASATFSGEEQKIMYEGIMHAFSCLPKANYLLISSTYDLESQTVDVLRAKFSFPIFTVGPSIPYSKLEDNSSSSSCSKANELNYLDWLDKQPKYSVLYISLGSFLSVSSEQMDEIAAGLKNSRVRFLWVARGEAARLKEACVEDELGLVVPWCDQLRVLSHPAIGGFLSHCGWNSVQEGIFSGIPFLTFPIVADQNLNSKLIVDDWKTGWRMKKSCAMENLVTREEIAELVREFMDLQNDEGKEMRRRAKELKELCLHAIGGDGSLERSIKSFISNISIGFR
ncbi:hypothetical protein SLEP1_g30808 [Rubroshorea leprosula]|uniref:Glycosyltransferase n=1 Tax=Rubroshorea leprosula TaxID=152421 RepID=A0AAV5K9W1_9ROSI|nr:hypothetical protein SLEP1_g30808 [Rubroshorea leprosula]